MTMADWDDKGWLGITGMTKDDYGLLGMTAMTSYDKG